MDLEVNGRTYNLTNHVLKRIKERGIKQDKLAEALKGEPIFNGTTLEHCAGNIRVLVGLDGNVITAYPETKERRATVKKHQTKRRINRRKRGL